MQLGPAPGQKGFGKGAAKNGMTGWQINEAAKVSVARFWNLTRSQIYRELLRLEDAGYVVAAGAPGARARQAYRVTDAGKAAFRGWLEEFASSEPRDEQLRSPLVLSVFFGEFLPPATLRRQLVEYRARHERQLSRLRAMSAALGERVTSPSRLPTAVLARGLAYQELLVGWIDDLLASERTEAKPKKRG